MFPISIWAIGGIELVPQGDEPKSIALHYCVGHTKGFSNLSRFLNHGWPKPQLRMQLIFNILIVRKHTLDDFENTKCKTTHFLIIKDKINEKISEWRLKVVMVSSNLMWPNMARKQNTKGKQWLTGLWLRRTNQLGFYICRRVGNTSFIISIKKGSATATCCWWSCFYSMQIRNMLVRLPGQLALIGCWVPAQSPHCCSFPATEPRVVNQEMFNPTQDITTRSVNPSHYQIILLVNQFRLGLTIRRG